MLALLITILIKNGLTNRNNDRLTKDFYKQVENQIKNTDYIISIKISNLPKLNREIELSFDSTFVSLSRETQHRFMREIVSIQEEGLFLDFVSDNKLTIEWESSPLAVFKIIIKGKFENQTCQYGKLINFESSDGKMFKIYRNY